MTSTQTATPLVSECPDCAATISLTAPIVGEIADCPDCGVELEVANLDPFTLVLAPEEAEDWGE